MPDEITTTTESQTQSTIGTVPQDLTESASQEWVKEQIELKFREARDESKKDIDKQVQIDKASLITVFGVFASIISFLTVEFQFLKTLCSMEKVLGFTLILFSLLLGFNICLDYVVRSRLEEDKVNHFGLYITIGLFLFVGAFFTTQGNEQMCYENKIYERYSIDFESKVSELKKSNSENFEEIKNDQDDIKSWVEEVKAKQLQNSGINKIQPTKTN